MCMRPCVRACICVRVCVRASVRVRTYLPVEDLLLPVPQGLDDLEDGVEEAKVTQTPRLIVKLLPLGLLGHAHKDVARLLLTNHTVESGRDSHNQPISEYQSLRLGCIRT